MATDLIARLGIMRLGRSHLGRVPPPPVAIGATVLVAGVNRRTQMDGVSVTDELNHEPDTASFRTDGSFVPSAGQEVRISLGSLRLFGGHLLSTDQLYLLKKENLACDCGTIEYSWLLKRRPVLKKYTNQSATAIVKDLIATFASGFTTVNVVAGLPVIDEITFTNEDLPDAITRTMARVGGYWRQDEHDIHAFLTETEMAGPITQASPRTMRNIRQRVHLANVATRVTARGGGSTTAGDVAIGSTSVPVEDPSFYAAGGGVVECGPQRIAYTGVVAGGTGSVVRGSVVTAPSAPTAAANLSGNLVGTYQYKVTFVIGGGESPLSAASTAVTTAPLVPDASAVALVEGTSVGARLPVGTVVRYRLAFMTAGGTEQAGKPSNPITLTLVGAAGGTIALGGGAGPIPLGPAGTTGRRLYRSLNGGAYLEVFTNPVIHTNNTVTSAVDGTASPAGGGTGAVPIDAGQQVTLTAVPLGPAGTTARRIYRTTGTGTVYLRVAEIADNTTTTLTDNTADGNLGNEAPIASTIPALAGDPALSVADLAAFPASGWVTIGAQLVRYTGRSGSSGAGTLTGIPAAGIVGALSSPVGLDAAVITAPHLSGATGVVYAINKGDQVNIVVTVNDVAAQTAMAAYIGSGDGIHEMPISDGRWSIAEATANALTELAQRKDPHVTIAFESRDRTIISGRSIFIHTTTPAIGPITVKIQRVTFSEIGLYEGVWPLRTVECSSTRRSFEDLLRDIRKAA